MKTLLHSIGIVLAALPLLAIPTLAASGTSGGWSGFSFGDAAGKNGTCADCHADASIVGKTRVIDQTRYSHTNHARIGCPSCHDAIGPNHPADRTASAKTACAECHPDIMAEYGTTVHASRVPCAGCHDPHRVNTPNEISGRDINRMCAGCHDNYQITASHARWLPQADLHIDMLPCISCHTGSRNYVINLYITKRDESVRAGKIDLATYDELSRLTHGKPVISLIDTNGDNYVSLTELRDFNRNPAYTHLNLKGVITPEKVTHSVQILENRRDCSFCHASGAGTMQVGYLSLPEPNGTFRRVGTEKGAVLNALSVTPDFYMTGQTRNKMMNIVGALIISGGMIMPVGHGFLRFLSRKIRNGREDHHV